MLASSCSECQMCLWTSSVKFVCTVGFSLELYFVVLSLGNNHLPNACYTHITINVVKMTTWNSLTSRLIFTQKSVYGTFSGLLWMTWPARLRILSEMVTCLLAVWSTTFLSTRGNPMIKVVLFYSKTQTECHTPTYIIIIYVLFLLCHTT